MKIKIISFLFISLSCLLYTSCEKNDDNLEMVSVTVPTVKSKTDIRNAISVTEPKPTNADGKIYVYEDLLFYVAQYSGIHIFDNHNPVSPQNLAFIKLEGVNDIAIKNNILYADNYMDLVVFDINNISGIELVNIEENILNYYASYPEDETDFFQNISALNQNEIITKYEVVDMNRGDVESQNETFYSFNMTTFENTLANTGSALANTIGVGGSLAKFQIYNDVLYTLEDYKINTFDISDYTTITLSAENFLGGWMGGELETTFIQKDYLFIGATNGMHILDLSDEYNPTYLSSFLHATGCDPVVVEGDTAYITVRGGNFCGAIEDQINVIDVSDIKNPVEHSTYFLPTPYGLGIKNQVLYVCNDKGLHVFDTQYPDNIVLKSSYDANIKDVIPLTTHLIGVGENIIYQFDYSDEFQLELISKLEF